MPYVSTDLTGQIAFVTGTTSGLGRRFAKVLAACGAKVAATGRRVERLEALAEEIRAEGGVCEPIAIDMTSRDSIRSALSRTRETRSGSNLVNNAGIPDAQRAVKMSDELTDAVFNTNLRGPWVLSCEVAKGLIEAELPGRIVNIASVAAFNTTAQSAATLIFNHQECRGTYDRISRGRVVAISNQRQLHRPRRILERDDGWDARADRRHLKRVSRATYL